MSCQSVFTCTTCGSQRGESNHWHLANVFLASELDGPDASGNIIAIQAWDSEIAVKSEAHLCGESCVHAFLSKWLESQSK
jgi:hypothetical protein